MRLMTFDDVLPFLILGIAVVVMILLNTKIIPTIIEKITAAIDD